MAEASVKDAVERRPSLNHFGLFALTAEYWRLADRDRREVRSLWIAQLAETAAAVHHYQTFPAAVKSDLLVWCVADAGEPGAAHVFFDAYARALRPFRRYVRMVDVLWGFTQPSPYSRAKSKQEIDPFSARSESYLVVYPFTKTVDWYMLDLEIRQDLMNEHIRIGKQYREVMQLLVYSTGLQDQEFVVVYEVGDLRLFSRLVAELRQTEARRYTQLDSPVHTAIHRPVSNPDGLWP